MFRLILLCFVLAMISLGINWLIDNDGLVSLEWLGYKIETNVSFLIIVGTVFLITSIILLQIIFWVFTYPIRKSHKRDVDKYNKGLLSLTEGFAAVSTHDVKSAKQLSKKTKKYLGYHQPLAILLDAQVAQMEGDGVKAAQTYQLLMQNKATKMIGLKGLLGEAQKTGDMEKAVTLAEETYRTSKQTESIVPVLLELYKRQGQWEKAILLVEKGQGKKAFAHFYGSSPTTIKREMAILYYMYARSYFDQDKLDRAIELAEKSHKYYALFAPSMTLIAQAAIKNEQKNKAISIIKKAWKSNPRPQLAEIYLAAYSSDSPKKKLKMAEKLASLNPHKEESNILIARAAIEAEDYTKARNHIKIAMADGDTVRGCSLMAKIEEVDSEGSMTTVNEWLERSSKSEQDPGWICKNCSSVSNKWELICGQCSSMDSYVWERPGAIKSKNISDTDVTPIAITS